MATAKKRGPKQVTDAHKAAMQAGRSESKAVREYLEALDANRPKRGRPRTEESVRKRLEALEAEFAEADALTRLHLLQEQMDLEIELASLSAKIDLEALETAFVANAKGYGERKGISYAAWRAIGVEAAVLKRAGISRSQG
jgi:hypothetical protein